MLNQILTSFVVTEEGITKIKHLMAQLVADVDAQAALLVEKSGQMIATHGDMGAFDTVALASLISGAFSATKAVARLIGETEFSAIFQQGQQISVFMVVLHTDDILAVIFRDAAKTGLVKVQAQQTAVALAAEITAMQVPPRG